jgi:uncharacterized protein (DUF2225 family)
MQKNKEEKNMEQNENIRKKKGGRPKKSIKKDQLLPVKCDKEEMKKIEDRARMVGFSVSKFMRKIAVNGQIDRREIIFPREVLQLIGKLNHAAAYLNQIAKKRNGIDELNALERATLQIQSRDLKKLAEDIKNYLK